MKKVLVVLAVGLTMILGSIAPAQAAPRYGTRFTARHGWIVWANNDRSYTITTRCHWYAGVGWHTRWRIVPGGFAWTTSDAGNYGDRRPSQLRCSYS